MTEEQCDQIEKEILRLDPERKRIFLDKNWVVHIVNNGRKMGMIHPLSFLDLAKAIPQSPSVAKPEPAKPV